jgi:nuclear transport factor 2 (NTF2) superfamily protein
MISQRVKDWGATWESRDPERVIAMYASDATHESGQVALIYPEAGGTTLRGIDQIREYFRRALARFTELRFEIVSAVEDESRAAIEYLRHSNVDGANPRRALELIEWKGGRISAVRVFHF